ncbi:MAG: beta-N-acetylhexosaminidase family protein, partial [Armatimonadota bacterium]
SAMSSVHVNCATITPHVGKTLEILERTLTERTGLSLIRMEGPAELLLEIRPGLGAEGYLLEDTPAGLLVAGNDETGLRYGVGKLLHGARFADGAFTPGSWRGVSVPQCSVRGMYCAFNFENWYAACPREKLARYLEELSLWGLNAIFYSIHFPDINDDAAFVEHIQATRQVIEITKAAGLRVGFLNCPNVGLPGIPPEMGAVDVPDTTPERRGQAGPRICPSKPGALEWLHERYEAYFTGYDDLGLDFVSTFPYDAGGCGCPDCWPWGYRGFIGLSKRFFEAARRHFPNCQRVLATWCYDVRDVSDGEFDGLDRLLREDASWVDMIMMDAHEDFPRWPLDHGTPGGLPGVNFPEITMWGRYPWGGFGANPLPARFERLWRQARELMDGGFPYSEGIFEDINKVLYGHFYWNKATSAEEAVREYVAYEFSPEVVEPVTRAIYLLEQTYPPETRTPEDVREAYMLLDEVDKRLPAWARQSWRWRILYLRALIDYEFLINAGALSERCDAAMEELIRIYCAEGAGGPVLPRSRRVRELRVGETLPPPPGAVPEEV